MSPLSSLHDRVETRVTSARFTLRLPDGDRDIEITAPADTPLPEIAAAIAAHAEVSPAPESLRTLRSGPLPAGRTFGRSGLRDGDVILLDESILSSPESEAGSLPAVAELVVTSGPAAGHRTPLPAGTHVVGREPGNGGVSVEDASLSRRHFEVTAEVAGRIAVRDLDSRNGTAVEGVLLDAGQRRDLQPHELLEAGRSLIAVQRWRTADATVATVRGTRIAFNRPPRVARHHEPAHLRIDPPPNPLRRVRVPLIAALAPLVMGLVLFAITKSPFMLATAAMSPIMMLGTYLADKRGGGREHADQVRRFESDVERLVAEWDQARRDEVTERRAALADASDLRVRARRHLPELWERRPADPDFLDVRVGVADQPTTTSVAFQPGGDPDLRKRVDELIAGRATVAAVPVAVPLAQIGALGVAGEPDAAERLARWLIAQVATLHSPRDVVVAAALGEDAADRWRWLGWLPHVTPPASPLVSEHVAVGEQPARELFKELAALTRERRAENEARAGGRGRRRRTSIVLLVDDSVAPEATLVDELLEDCADLQLAVVWLAGERRDIPGGAGAILELSRGRAAADLTFAASGRRIAGLSLDGLSAEVAEEIARSLAPVQDVTAGGGAADIPRSVALLELLDLVEPSGDRVAERWRGRRGSALGAALGAGAGDQFSIDLRADGPHALVAGTTGAGKSELLQSLIASLAATHPPDRIAFLLVDYKGGAAFKDCRHLPHAVGMVTDLDEHEVRRALVSLEAELKRREHVLAAAGAKDLTDLERRDPAGAPPSLVIVVDEFATLAKDVPAFVDGVVDVAQRGRSLGVHLVLATQRPGNAVTENIRANTSLRVALRVAGTNESDDVINAPDAARLPRTVPGRALARTGPGELTEFQAAYVGGRTVLEQVGAEQVTIGDLRFGAPVAPAGRIAPEAAERDGEDEEEEITDLQRLVAAVTEATSLMAIEPPAPPWLPPLPEVVTLQDAAALAGEDPRAAAASVGVIDEPRRQRRGAYVIDLEADGNLLVYGATAAGKTTFLRTLAAGLAARTSPTELQVYGLDCAGRGLAGIEALPHCGSVVFGEDDERVTRLLGMLRRTIDNRARRFAARGVLTLAEYRAAEPHEPMPRMLVLLDSYAGFTDIYEKVNLGALVEAFPRLVADGRAAGVHFVITGDRRMAIPQSITSVVARRLVLRMADDDEYTMLGVDAKEARAATLPPGRGFLDDGHEVQCAVVGGEVAGDMQNAALVELAAEIRLRHPDVAAPAVPRLPVELDRAELPAASRPLAAVIGVDDVDLSPLELSFEDSHGLVAGPYRSGRSAALETIARALAADDQVGELHLLAPRRSPLSSLDIWTTAARGTDACEQRVAALVEALYARAEGSGDPLIVVILDDGGELIDTGAASGLETLLKRGRDYGLRIIGGFETSQARHYSNWIKELRKDGVGILLDPSTDIDGELLGVRLPRRGGTPFPPGRGYAVSGGVARLVHVASGSVS